MRLSDPELNEVSGISQQMHNRIIGVWSFGANTEERSTSRYDRVALYASLVLDPLHEAAAFRSARTRRSLTTLARPMGYRP
jgi:hypothetical protein